MGQTNLSIDDCSQMKLAGGASVFNQPLMSDNLGGIPAVNFQIKLILTVSAIWCFISQQYLEQLLILLQNIYNASAPNII